MDIGFEILLPITSKIENIKFVQPTYEWEGEHYPQGNEEAWYNYFKLVKSEVPKYLLAYLPNNFQNYIWQCLSVVDGLSSYKDEVMHQKDYYLKDNNILIELLNKLISKEKKWVVNFEPDFDGIDEVFEGTIDFAVQKINYSLKNNGGGFIIWSDN